MLERLSRYLRPPIFPDDEDKTFMSSLLHVVLWSVLLGTILYTLVAPIPSSRQLVAWSYALGVAGLALGLLYLTRRGHVLFSAAAINIGLFIILTTAAYFNGGVVAPAYGGYIMVVVCASLLVGWQWGLIATVAATLIGAIFLLAADNGRLPEWASTYSFGSVWGANVAYFFIVFMLLALALRVIKRAAQQTRDALIERQKTQQALSHSEQRFRAIFDAVNDAIFVQALGDGRILDVNQKMCEMYGYTPEEARQLIIGDLSVGDAPYTQENALTWMKKAASGVPQIFEWQSIDHAGRLFWTEVNMRRAVIDGQDRLLVVVRDIDERKRAEATLRREQAYYEAIVNATPVMLWLKDTENRTLHLNPAAAAFEGVEAAQVEGKLAAELYPPEQAAAFYRDDLEVIQSGQSKLGIVEEHTATGTGKKMWVETGKVPVRDEQGNIVGVLACAVDITARKEAEQVQAATRQIAEAALMTQNLEEFYRSVHAVISPLVPANNFYIALYDAANDQFSVPYQIDEFDQARPPYRPGKGLNAYVMRSGEPLLAAPEVFAELERQGQAEIINRRMVEWLGVPLKTPQGLLGVMAVQNYSGPVRLSEKHKDLLVFVSAQVAMAIERKRAEERDRRNSQGLRAVIEAAQELIDCADLDTLYRRSVELAREKIGLERCGLYLLDEREESIQGTFGTDDQGQTIDERRARHPVQERPEVFSLSDQLWFAFESVPSYWNEDHVQWLAGKSWNVATPIRSRRRTVGVLYNDAAITRTPLDETQQDMTAVYCSLLGSLFELKRTEADLVAERDLLQLLMDNFPDTIYFKDTASRFTRINRAQARILGVAAPEAAIGKTDADFFQDSELNQMFLAEEQRLMASGEPIIDRLEYNPAPNGQPRWLSASKVPLRGASGQIVGMVGISRDVTDRILAQRRDQTISQGLRAVIGTVDDLMDCADLDTLYRRAVELARDQLGAERCGLFILDEQGWLCGTYGTDMQRQTTDERGAHFPPVSLEGFDAASDQLWILGEAEQTYWDAAQQQIVGKGWIGTTFIRTRDRVIGVVYNDTAITQAPVDEAQQEVLAVYCSLLGSLIELKRVEEAQRESEATTRALLEAIPDAFFRFDANGVFKEYIPSREFASLLPPGEFIGKPYAAVLPPDVVEQLDLNFRHVLERGELRSYEYPLLIGEEVRYFEARLVKMAQGDVLGIVRDVTDRKRTELALLQREAYLRSIFDNFPYWVWLKDVAGHFLAVNQTMAQAFGFEQARAMIGKTDRDTTTPELAEKYYVDDRAVMESRTQKLVEEIVLDRKEERWFETFKSPIFDAQGQVIGTTGFAHDITARRQAEAAIRESETLFRQLADNAPAFIAMNDETGMATYLNRAWREFRGDVPALSLEDWAERIHPDDRRRYTHEFRSALQGQRRFTTEFRLRRADGQYRWLLDTVVPRYAADEQFAGFISIAIDITDRKNAEEALRRSEGRLRLITDNMADSISQVDAQQRLVYASPSAERDYGHTLRDLLGRSLYDFVHPEDGSRLYHQVVMAKELLVPSLRLEYRYRHAAGHYLWVESEMRLLYDERGDFTGAVFGSRDISSRKQIEAERENLIKELEDKNAELERFTYTVSHDLKSPLITIRGFLGFLEKDAASGNLDRLRADIARIVEATTRMQRLLDEMLELSRVGRMSNPPEEVAFGQIAQEAVDLVYGRLTARGVQVEIADNLPVVYVDRMRLVEAVQNLVDNAAKFMGDQPEPRIVIGALGAERANMPVFFVEDNGLGIEPEYHERIFGLFNKLDAKSEGTGVGLALVKRIIDQHGGYIWVESDGAGHGSTFFFTLPRPASTSRKS